MVAEKNPAQVTQVDIADLADARFELPQDPFSNARITLREDSPGSVRAEFMQEGGRDAAYAQRPLAENTARLHALPTEDRLESLEALRMAMIPARQAVAQRIAQRTELLESNPDTAGLKTGYTQCRIGTDGEPNLIAAAQAAETVLSQSDIPKFMRDTVLSRIGKNVRARGFDAGDSPTLERAARSAGVDAEALIPKAELPAVLLNLYEQGKLQASVN